MVNRDLQLVGLPELFTLEIVIQENIDNIREVRTMERNTDDEKPDMEDGFVFGEGDFALVKTRGGTDSAESSNETIESTGRASDNECLDTVVEGDAKLGVFGKIFVGCRNMAL